MYAELYTSPGISDHQTSTLIATFEPKPDSLLMTDITMYCGIMRVWMPAIRVSTRMRRDPQSDEGASDVDGHDVGAVASSKGFKGEGGRGRPTRGSTQRKAFLPSWVFLEERRLECIVCARYGVSAQHQR